jgi:flagellin-like hook-associated protein FlgL
MSDIVERLRLHTDPLNPTERSALADEIERLHAHIVELEAWQQKGQKLFDNYAVGLGAMFGLGKWWGERPWR